MLFGIVTRSYTKMKCTKHGISQQNKFLGGKYENSGTFRVPRQHLPFPFSRECLYQHGKFTWSIRPVHYRQFCHKYGRDWQSSAQRYGQ